MESDFKDDLCENKCQFNPPSSSEVIRIVMNQKQNGAILPEKYTNKQCNKNNKRFTCKTTLKRK